MKGSLKHQSSRAQTLFEFDYYSVPSPCYVVDLHKLRENLSICEDIQARSGAKILLALKAFSMFSLAPTIMQSLKGVCASGLHEATLGREEFGGEVHTYCAAFIEKDFDRILQASDHLVFNSFSQWQKYQKKCAQKKQKNENFSVGLRINPEHSEGGIAMYNPCSPCSRMGIPIAQFTNQDLTGIDGLHFHTLCEQGYAPLERTLDVIEKEFGPMLPNLKWLNLGGGHHITHKDYDRDALIAKIQKLQSTYNLQVYLEPGEAIALDAGVFVTEVLDTVDNTMPIAIIDSSATCHMPDVLEMPYRPRLRDESIQENATIYRLGGPSCLAGDIIGDYAFDTPLTPGDRLCFEDMAIYTMVKSTTFNGINLPTIATWDATTNAVDIIKTFGYSDFKMRLS